MAGECHGIAVPVCPRIAAGSIAANLAGVAGAGSPRLWVESVDVRGDDEPGLRRYQLRELGRPLAAGGPGIRVVLLRCLDGAGSLVLVARRRVLGLRGLEKLADVLTRPDGHQAQSLVIPDALPQDLSEALPEALPEARGARGSIPWGLGDPLVSGAHGTCSASCSLAAPDHVLLAAVGLAASRYGSCDAVSIGIVRPGTAGLLRDEVLAWRADAAGRTAGSWRDEALGLLHGGAVPGMEGTAPMIGVVLTERRAWLYQPCMAPMFPLTIWLERAEDGSVSGRCLFDETVVSPGIAGQFVRHCFAAAAQLDELPADAPLAEVRVPPEEEIPRILAAGSQAAEGFRPWTIHARFEDIAARRPGSIAYCDDRDRLSYGELDRRADGCARALREHGVAPGDLVGVCLDPGAELLVVLLAIVKAGAAYVPMDTRNPAERLGSIVEDAGVALVITEMSRFPAVPGTRLVAPGELASQGRAVPRTTGGPDDPAYVIFTSGSTGRPKGVVVPHRNVAALLAATQTDMRLGPGDVWTWYHSSAFDFSVWEIWGCLLTGGRLVGVPYWVSRSPTEFTALLARERVTVLSQTPSAFTQLIEADDRGEAGEMAVRLVVLGGEHLDVRVLRRWMRRHPHSDCRVVNMYGITETTVHVTSRTVTPRDVVSDSQSVGKALPGWSVSVRDGRGRPVPFGVCGEIYVGGVGVALRYLNRPQLTAERFTEDRFGGGRVYRSGDRGRLRPDGTLDHLGRLDNQVQLRGYRVELDEIRSVLLEIPYVSAAAVAVAAGRDATQADARLDAYVVLRAPHASQEIKARLREVLPDYMIPNTVTAVAELPLTINGKVDLGRLPDPLAARRAPGSDPGSAAGLVGTVLRAWEKAFSLRMAIDDDFFDLGGNSLMAVKIMTEIRREGFPAMDLRDLYRNPTVRSLSAALSARAGNGAA